MARRTEIKLWAWLLFFLMLLMACAGGEAVSSGYSENGSNAPMPDVSGAGPVISMFPAAWQACGGLSEAGQWLGGPYWYGDQLVMVYTNMVLGWSLEDIGAGVRPLNINRPSGPQVETHAPGMAWSNNHNVPKQFAHWIGNYGGWFCSGPPVSPLMKRGGEVCQDFSHITLCMPASGGQVYPVPRGREFLANNQGHLTTQITPVGGKEWNVQVVAESEGQHGIRVSASVLHNTSIAPSGPILAVSVRENGAQWPFYYSLARWGGAGAWQKSISVPNVSEGSTRFVARVCVYFNGAWLACGEDSTQVWKP